MSESGQSVCSHNQPLPSPLLSHSGRENPLSSSMSQLSAASCKTFQQRCKCFYREFKDFHSRFFLLLVTYLEPLKKLISHFKNNCHTSRMMTTGLINIDSTLRAIQSSQALINCLKHKCGPQIYNRAKWNNKVITDVLWELITCRCNS